MSVLSMTNFVPSMAEPHSAPHSAPQDGSNSASSAPASAPAQRDPPTPSMGDLLGRSSPTFNSNGYSAFPAPSSEPIRGDSVAFKAQLELVDTAIHNYHAKSAMAHRRRAVAASQGSQGPQGPQVSQGPQGSQRYSPVPAGVFKPHLNPSISSVNHSVEPHRGNFDLYVPDDTLSVALSAADSVLADHTSERNRISQFQQFNGPIAPSVGTSSDFNGTLTSGLSSGLTSGLNSGGPAGGIPQLTGESPWSSKVWGSGGLGMTSVWG